MWNLRTSEILREGGRNVRKKRSRGSGAGWWWRAFEISHVAPHCQSFWRSLIFFPLGILFGSLDSISPWKMLKEGPRKALRAQMLFTPYGMPKRSHPSPCPQSGQPVLLQQQAGGPPAGGEPSHLSFLSSPLLIAALGSLQSVVDENIILLCLVPASPCPRHWSSRGDAALWFGADR